MVGVSDDAEQSAASPRLMQVSARLQVV